MNELTAAEAYQLIEPCLMTSQQTDPLERTRLDYQFQLLASKLPSAVIEEMLEMGRGGGVALQRLNPLFGAYAVRDWDRAMAWAETQTDSARLRAAGINSLAHVDPVRAGELYQKLLLDGQPWAVSMEIRNNLAAAHARLGPEAFFRFVDSMPSDRTLGLTGLAIRNVPPEEFPGFMEEVKRRVTAGNMNTWEIDNLVGSMASTRPDLARQWIEQMVPEDKRADYELNLAMNLSSSLKPEEAEELMRNAMARKPGEQKALVTNRLYNTFSSAPEMTAKLAAMLPEDQRLTREDVRTAMAGYYHRPEHVMDITKLIGSQEEQADYLVESFDMLGNPRFAPALGGRANPNAKDLEILEHRLEALGLTGEAGEKARAALERARERVQEKK